MTAFHGALSCPDLRESEMLMQQLKLIRGGDAVSGVTYG